VFLLGQDFVDSARRDRVHALVGRSEPHRQGICPRLACRILQQYNSLVMAGVVTLRILALLLVAGAAVSCGGNSTKDDAGISSPSAEEQEGGPASGGSGGYEGAQQTAGTGGSAGADRPEQSTGTGAAAGALGLESRSWRANLDYGDSATPWVVNASIHGSSATDVYVAGYLGMQGLGFVDHLVGNEWEPLYEGNVDLLGVWTASPSLVFAVGYNRIVRLNGSEATVQDFGDLEVLTDVWGSSQDDILAVGFGGRILHYDGEQWAIEAGGTGTDLRAVWGSDPDSVFVVGKSGVILTRDGGTWSSMQSGTSVDLKGVWGSGPTDVYAVGGSESDPGHVVLHYDGSRWSTVHTGDSRRSALIGISGRSAADICAVGAFRDDAGTPHALLYHFDGSVWQEVSVDA